MFNDGQPAKIIVRVSFLAFPENFKICIFFQEKKFVIVITFYSLSYKLPWPGNSERTFLSSSQVFIFILFPLMCMK